MENQDNNSKPKFSFSTIIGFGTLIVTIIALIPAFLSLNKEKPNLYYSYSHQSSETPAFVNETKFKKFLKENNIPSNRFTIKMKNVGNAPAEVIKFSVNVPGVIVRYAYNPSNKENPVWVDVPENKDFGFESDISSSSQVVKNLSPNKILTFSVGFEQKDKGFAETEVFFNGKQAKFAPVISEVPEWSPYKIFILPLTILGIGLGCTILWVTVSILLKNQKIREELVQVLKAIGEGFIRSFLH